MPKIKFTPASSDCELLIPHPKPSKIYIPDWYKNIKPVDKNFPKFDEKGVQINTNLKMCMPFLDTFTTGYIQETWSDIYIKIDEIEKNVYNVSIANPVGPEHISYRKNGTRLPISDEYFPIEFIWLEQWKPIMPKGYSALFTHPLNRVDLPFYSLNGIVDSDIYYHELAGAFPFFLKKEYNGKIIPVGTPMYQIIPIKRESWKSEKLEYDDKKAKTRKQSIRKYIFDGYKNYFWQKKDYS